MALVYEELILVIFSFMVVILTFPICRARVRPTLYLMDGIVQARYFPLVAVYSRMRNFLQRLWWIDLKQNIHYDVVKGDVWHTTTDMLNRKYRQTYRMSFLAFEQLVAEFIPFLYFIVQMFVRPLILIRKQMCLVVYRFAHGFLTKLWIICMVVKNIPLENTPLLFVGSYLLEIDYLVRTFTHLEV
jgi:hypothetical protein